MAAVSFNNTIDEVYSNPRFQNDMQELITKNGIDEKPPSVTGSEFGTPVRYLPFLFHITSSRRSCILFLIYYVYQAAKSDPAPAPETEDLSHLNNENENEEGGVVDDDYDASFSKMYLLSIQTVSALGESEQA